MNTKIKIKKNSKSNTYFLPLFSNFCKLEYIHLLENTYFWYNDDSLKKDTFCILYKFDGKVRGNFNGRVGFTIYEENTLMSHPLFLNHYDYNEYVLYEFELNDFMVNMRTIMLNGKFSHIEKTNKQLIIDFNLKRYGMHNAKLLEKILYKDEKLRKQLAESLGYRDLPEEYELTSLIEIENEIFTRDLVTIENKENKENENNKIC